MNIRKDQWMAQVWDTNKSPKDPKYEARTKGNHLILASDFAKGGEKLF